MKKTIYKPLWDATIDSGMCDKYNNAELTLTLKLAFKQVNPAAGALSGVYHDYGDSRATARKIARWSPADSIAWKMSFIRSAEQFWKGKF